MRSTLCLFFLVPWLLFAEEIAITEDIPPSRPTVLKETSRTSQEEACRDLKPGESRSVNEADGSDSTRLYRRFQVTRDATNAKLYHVDIPIDFESGDENLFMRLFGTVLTPEQMREGLTGDFRARYFHRANQCFENILPYLKDPDGNQIHLRLVPTAKDPSTPASRIRISTIDRSDYTEWNFNADCGTIVHEALHLLGLTDGYVERSEFEYYSGLWPFGSWEKANAFNCRPEQPRSMMNGHFNLIPPLYNFVVCEAPRRTAQSELPMKVVTIGLNEEIRDCAGSILSRGSPEPLTESTIDDIIARQFNRKGITVLKIQMRPPDATLLRSQVKFITNPYCTRDNNYFACTRNDYRTREIDDCVDLPESCRGGLQ